MHCRGSSALAALPTIPPSGVHTRFDAEKADALAVTTATTTTTTSLD